VRIVPLLSRHPYQAFPRAELPSPTFMDTPPFSELGLPDPILAAIQDMGFESPSPIQAKTIPLAMTGKDLVGLSQTGSGKTAAFGLPVLADIDTSLNETQALVVCPTRELAVQVCEEIFRLGSKIKGLHAMPVYGGAPIDRQLRGFKKGAHIVVGTPGRLLDHLKRRSFNPKFVKTVILDEADRMLDMGFREEMEDLLGSLPKERQILFFSATMNRGVSRLIQSFGNDPEVIEIERKALTVSSIDQACYEVRQRSKIEVLSRLLDINPPKLAVVFCNTKRLVDEVTESLLARGYTADRLLGAPDVAARGLDIDDVELVVNYEIPHDPEDYVHRIGRTGRAGRDGRAVTFVYGRDIYRLQTIEKFTRQTIRRERVPSKEQVEGKRADNLFEAVRERLEKGDQGDYGSYLDRLLEQGHTATDIANAAITLLREATTREGQAIDEDRQKEPFTNERQRSNWRDEKRERGSNRFERDQGGRRERGDKPTRNNSPSSPNILSSMSRRKMRKTSSMALKEPSFAAGPSVSISTKGLRDPKEEEIQKNSKTPSPPKSIVKAVTGKSKRTNNV